MTEEPLPAWSLPTDAVERIALPEAWPGEVTREWLVEAVHDPTVKLLRKPFTAEELLEAVQEMLQSSASLRQRSR